MATFDPIPYSYVPTAPRFKSTTLRQTPAQKELGTSNKTAIESESYGSQIREIDTVCDASQKNIGLEDSELENESWKDETASYPKEGCSLSRRNESAPLFHKELIDRPGNDRSTQDKPLILEGDESNLSDSESSVHIDSVPKLSKQDRPNSQKARLNIENEDSGKDDNRCLSQQNFAYTPSQHQLCFCDDSSQSAQSEIDLYTDDEVAQPRSEISHHKLFVPLAVDNGKPNQGSAFGYEVGLFPVFDEQEELLAISPLSSHSHGSAKLSHPQIGWEHHQSTSNCGRSEELRHRSSLHFREKELQKHQHQQEVAEIIKKQDNNKENQKKRLYTSETEIDNNDENNENPQSPKRRKLYSLSTENAPVSSPDRCILTSSSTTQSEANDVQCQSLNGYSPISIDDDPHSPQTSSSPSIIIDPAPVAAYQEWPFKGFLKRTRIGDETTYNLEFQLQHVPEHLHHSVLSEVLKTTSAEASNPCNTLHSKIRPTKLPIKRKRVPWEAEEHKTILRMKQNGCSWEDIHHALPHRTPAAIQVQYSTKLKR